MSSTGNQPAYIRHTYEVSNKLKSYTVYKLAEVIGNKNLLTEIVRIEKYQGKSNASNISDYLRLKTTTNWNTSELVTGLRPTVKTGLFQGNRVNKETHNKTLLLFTFLTGRETLLIDVYRGFYPNHNGILQNIICTR